MILEEFDNNVDAVINPWNIVKKREGIPKVIVSCFARATFDRIVRELNAVPFSAVSTANTTIDIYCAEYCGYNVGLVMADIGAPSCVAVFEEIYQMGAETVILFGTCGVLDASIADCSVIIPNSAVRDEGTSYHYAPASDEIVVNTKYTDLFIKLLEEFHCSYIIGKTWTTDAIYRETKRKVFERKAQGCICVEMECAAMTAMAQFRQKEFFTFFYAADNLDAEQWDMRSLSNDSKLLEKDRIAQLALELAKEIYMADQLFPTKK